MMPAKNMHVNMVITYQIYLVTIYLGLGSIGCAHHIDHFNKLHVFSRNRTSMFRTAT